jgi:hypothetical protein
MVKSKIESALIFCILRMEHEFITVSGFITVVFIFNVLAPSRISIAHKHVQVLTKRGAHVRSFELHANGDLHFRMAAQDNGCTAIWTIKDHILVQFMGNGMISFEVLSKLKEKAGMLKVADQKVELRRVINNKVRNQRLQTITIIKYPGNGAKRNVW